MRPIDTGSSGLCWVAEGCCCADSGDTQTKWFARANVTSRVVTARDRIIGIRKSEIADKDFPLAAQVWEGKTAAVQNSKKPRVLWLTHSPRPAVRYRPLPTSFPCSSSLRNFNKVRSLISLR